MIQILLKARDKYFVISIENKVLKYWDERHGRIFGKPLQYLPPDDHLKTAILYSRNSIPEYLIPLLDPDSGDLDDYANARNDRDLQDFVLRDCRRAGIEVVRISQDGVDQ